MKTIAILIARAGSKGLPGKNIKELAGKPLLAYSIEQAHASGVCDCVLVSTEDEQIAQVARRYGALVPFIRPKELATDSIPAEPVVKHALETYEAISGDQFDIVVYLQPTDIFRTPEMIRECVQRLKANPELDSVFVAYKTHKNFWRWFPEKGYVRLAQDLATYRARQEREEMIFREDAGLASASRSHVIRSGKRLGERVEIVPTDDFRTSIDIHTPFDFWMAEQILLKDSNDPSSGSLNEEEWLGKDLTSWSQGIRSGYTKAFILFALHETGVFEALRQGPAKTSEELAQRCGLNAHLLDGVLNFLAFSDRVLKKEADRFSLTQRGEWLFADPVLAMSYGAVGAYACLLTELVSALRNQRRYGVDFKRRGDLLARGSFYTGKGNYPWVVSEMVQRGVKTFADLGCGSAEVLIAFCRLDPHLKGVGIDISQEALQEARQRVQEAELSDRIALFEGDFTRPETFADRVGSVEAFNGIMSFHEFLRDGEEAVVGLFKRLKEQFPGRLLFVGEFNRLRDEEWAQLSYPARIHPLFYQYLIHPLTWQGLPTTQQRWLAMFERAGLKILLVKDDFPFRLVEYVLRLG